MAGVFLVDWPASGGSSRCRQYGELCLAKYGKLKEISHPNGFLLIYLNILRNGDICAPDVPLIFLKKQHRNRLGVDV
jgi:hypothetical protein